MDSEKTDQQIYSDLLCEAALEYARSCDGLKGSETEKKKLEEAARAFVLCEQAETEAWRRNRSQQ